MQSKLFRKGLVVGIIVLFVGLAFIPSFNAVSISMLENHPPEAPLIKLKEIIEPLNTASFTFKAEDPDDDCVRYFIDWDDGTTEWTECFPSDFPITISHTWEKQGTFFVRARANDTHGALGPWGYWWWSKADKDEIEGDLVDNVQLTWLGTITFSDIFLAFLGLPVYFTQAKIKNNNDVAFSCEAYITLTTGDGKILDECIYNPPFNHNPHSTDTLLMYTLHNWQDYNYLWGHFDITINYHILDDDSSITKVFHGFVFRYGSFIYDKNGEVIS